MKKLLVITAWYPSKEEPFNAPFVSQQVKIMQEYLTRQTNGGWRIAVWHQQQPFDLPTVLLKGKRTKNFDWYDEGVPVLTRQGLVLTHRWKHPQQFCLNRGMNKTFDEIRGVLGGEPDVIWTVTLAGALRWHAFTEKKNLRIPFVVQEHSNTIWMHLKNKQNIKRAKRVFNDAAKLIVVADRQLDQFKKIEPLVEPVVIWNAVAPVYLKKCNPTVPGLEVIFVGRLSPEKGLICLMRAFAKLLVAKPDARLKLVGQGPQRKSLEKEIRTLGIEASVTFLGSRRSEEIVTLLDNSSVFVLPSEYENCPVALLEAQVRGVPSVVRINNASEKVLLPGNGLAVEDNGDGIGLARGFETLFNTMHLYTRESIQQSALQAFAPEVFAAKMAVVFNEALK